MTKFAGKVVMITGGGSWIGRAIAISFAKKGAKCFLIGRTEVKLKETASAISELENKPDVDYAVADVSNEAEMQKATRQAIEKFGKLDGASKAGFINAEDITIDGGQTRFSF